MTMKNRVPLSICIVLLCSSIAFPQTGKTLLEKRGDFKTSLTEEVRDEEKLPEPPEDAPFTLVQYPTSIGKMSAYVTKPDEDAGKVPAIVWITGGFPIAGGGDMLWERTSIDNEQSARIFRINDMMMMFPSVRGTAGNPGFQENFYGEINDIIDAGKFLAKHPNVDPNRLYLGGHSTGGTAVLLVAASTSLFKGVISLGPTDTDYGEDDVPYKVTAKESFLRHPINHLSSIRVPTWIVEGAGGNRESLVALAKADKNPMVRLAAVRHADHFDCIHPVNEVFAEVLMESTEAFAKLDTRRLSGSFIEANKLRRESDDLESLAEYRSDGLSFDKPLELTYYLLADTEAELSAVMAPANKVGFRAAKPNEFRAGTEEAYWAVDLVTRVDVTNLKSLFARSAAAQQLAWDHKVEYDSWTAEEPGK